MTTINHTKLWEKCKSIIKDNISTEEYNQWFAPIVPVKYEKNEEKNEKHSLISISELSQDEVKDIRTDYRKGLNYIIEFIENWE